jgi:hypothetical protein
MFRRAQREPDLEGNHGGHARHDILDFDDPSWIIDHHRRHLITKISKQVDPWFYGLLAQSSDTNNDPDHKCVGSRNSHNHKTSTDEQQLGPHNQQRKGETSTIHGQLEGCEQSYRINFSELQRLRLRQLQHNLIQHTVDLRYDAMEPAGWAEDLRQYGKFDSSPK